MDADTTQRALSGMDHPPAYLPANLKTLNFEDNAGRRAATMIEAVREITN